MKLLGNLLWFVLGGWAIFVEYALAGAAMCATIIGIPFGIQCFKLALVGAAPFGQLTEQQNASSFSVVLNLIWMCLAGIWISLTHLGLAILFCLTIVGIPFAIQHLKLAKLALFPFGKTLKSH